MVHDVSESEAGARTGTSRTRGRGGDTKNGGGGGELEEDAGQIQATDLGGSGFPKEEKRKNDKTFWEG